MKAIFRRIVRLETQCATQSAGPVHMIIFEGDPEPTDLPLGSTVHRIRFVAPANPDEAAAVPYESNHQTPATA